MNIRYLSVLIWSMSGASSLTYGDEPKHTFYAKLNVSNQQSDEGNGAFTETRSNNSRVGIKGSESLDDEFTAFYRLEWRANITSESGEDAFSARSQYVGLRSKFGEIALGRDKTALGNAQGKIDQFNDFEGDLAAIWKGEKRLSDTTTYTSPRFQRIRAVVTYRAEQDADSDSSTSAGIYYGDRSLRKSKVFATVAHDFDVAGYDVTRASAQFLLGKTKLGLIVQVQEATDPLNTEGSQTGGLISLKQPIGHWDILGQYQTLEDDNTVNIGINYRFNSNAKVYTWYTNIDQENAEERTYFAIGFEYKFSKGL